MTQVEYCPINIYDVFHFVSLIAVLCSDTNHSKPELEAKSHEISSFISEASPHHHEYGELPDPLEHKVLQQGATQHH